ncbi:MAG: hypothetical protein AAFP70_00300 [Calditrichota bacterium]
MFGIKIANLIGMQRSNSLYINMWEGIVQGNVKIHHPPADFTPPSAVNPSYSYE